MARINPIPAKKLIRVLKHFGFTESRQSGSHLSMTKDGVLRPLIIPMHKGDLPVLIILSNLRSAGISREEYLRVLGSL